MEVKANFPRGMKVIMRVGRGVEFGDISSKHPVKSVLMKFTITYNGCIIKRFEREKEKGREGRRKENIQNKQKQG